MHTFYYIFSEAPLPLAPSKALKGSEIIDKYKECVVHYSKYRHAGVIETEASIKAEWLLGTNKMNSS